MNFRCGSIAVFVIASSVAGCASVVESPHQKVAVNTNPSGATCVLTRGGEIVGSIAATPGSVTVDKTRNDMMIQCSKPGYQTVTLIDDSDFAAWTVGNVVIGGLVGLGIDSATGAIHKYDGEYNLQLVVDQSSSLKDSVVQTVPQH